MVTASELKCCLQTSAWNSPNLNHATALLRPGHQLGVPSFDNPSIFAANAVSAGPSAFFPGLPDFKEFRQNGINGWSSSVPTESEYLNDAKCFIPHLIGVKSPPTDASTNAQKRFLICDQSGNQTRFFFNQDLPGNESIISKGLFGAYGLCYENLTALVEQSSPVNPIIEDKLDGSYVNGEESNIHEDTEEINALLYTSDSSEGEEEDDDYGEDDDVASTGHSPCAKSFGEPAQQSGVLTEDVLSSDGACKRQRLPCGGYKRSSLADTASCTELARRDNDDNDDVESRCVIGYLPLTGKDKKSSLSTRKVKIRETLRILESLIPGLKSKDPLLVIDEAIDYLKSLRVKAKALGFELPQEYPPASY